MQRRTNKILFYILLFLSFITVVYIYISADATYDTGDGISHYLISRYSWKHPVLFLDWWGKPFFTMVSSPFTQFGLKGMYVFQAVNAAATSWFLFSIASKMNLKFTWIIPALVFFAPIYFAVMNSGLVEIFFGTMFIFSVWLVFNKRFYASAIVASLIPFVRPEAYVVIPLLLLVYIYRKKFLAIPFLLTGTIVYTLAGYPHFKDLFWIITNNYTLIGDNYIGYKGSYFHYFHLYDEIWGTVYTVLLLIGIGIILHQVYQFLRRKLKQEYVIEVLLLFLGSTVGCFVLHSLLCGMPGILNNLGMVRYLAVLIPGSALIALIGLNILNNILADRFRYLQIVMSVAILFLVVRSTFSQWYYPFISDNEGVVMKQMGVYLQNNWPGFKKISFQHPLLPTVANIDPFDDKKAGKFWLVDMEKINTMPDSTLILWDSHFMGGEVNVPFKALSENPNLILLKQYRFIDENRPFEASLFLKIGKNTFVAKPVQPEFISEKGLFIKAPVIDSIVYTIDNEANAFIKWKSYQVQFLEKTALEFNSEAEFGPVFSNKIGDFNLKGNFKSVKLSFSIYQSDTLMKMISVIEIKNGDNQVSWEGLINKNPLKPNQWNSIELRHTYSNPLKNPDETINIYFWNKEKQKLYISDLKIVFLGIN